MHGPTCSSVPTRGARRRVSARLGLPWKRRVGCHSCWGGTTLRQRLLSLEMPDGPALGSPLSSHLATGWQQHWQRVAATSGSRQSRGEPRSVAAGLKNPCEHLHEDGEQLGSICLLCPCVFMHVCACVCPVCCLCVLLSRVSCVCLHPFICVCLSLCILTCMCLPV